MNAQPAEVAQSPNVTPTFEVAQPAKLSLHPDSTLSPAARVIERPPLTRSEVFP
jgi:hypothetical protein